MKQIRHYRSSGIRIAGEGLHCKNECGFYGSPQWDGFCSKCRIKNRDKKEILERAEQRVRVNSSSNSHNINSNVNNNKESVGKSFFSGWNPSTVNPQKFKNLLKVFKIGNDPAHTWMQDDESNQATLKFQKYLIALKNPIGIDVFRQVKGLLDELKQFQKFRTMDDVSMCVHKFYQAFEARLLNHDVYKDCCQEMKESISNEVENYLCVLIYPGVFSTCPLTDDESRDLELQKRIRSLRWITRDMLDCQVHENGERERVHMEDAMHAIIEMNTFRSPQQKLSCIVQCCKAVFRALRAYSGADDCSAIIAGGTGTNIDTSIGVTTTGAQTIEQSGHSTECSQDFSITSGTCSSSTTAAFGDDRDAGVCCSANADDFLPALIYLILKTNPPLLLSNLQFISRFGNPKRLGTGESGYFFTNVSCAVYFIENINHESLSLSCEQFNRYMEGDESPNEAAVIANDMNETVARINDNERRLVALSAHVVDVDHCYTLLEEDIQFYYENLIQRFDRLEANHPYPSPSLDQLEKEIQAEILEQYPPHPELHMDRLS